MDVKINSITADPKELYQLYEEIVQKETLPTTDSEIYGDQVKFQKFREKAIKEVTNLLKKLKGVDSNDNLKSILIKMGKIRKIIASNMKSGSADKYGLLRTSSDEEQFSITHLLNEKYRKTNQTIREIFYKYLLELETTPTQNWETNSSKFSLEIFDSLKLGALIQNFGQEKNSKEKKIQLDLANAFYTIFNLLHQLKIPELTSDIFPNLGKIQFIVGTIYTKNKDEWQVLTRHISWIKLDDKGETKKIDIEFFKKYAFVTLLHTPKINTDFILDDLENIFYTLVNNETTPDEFNNFLRSLNYYLSHAIIFCRGSALTTEILIESLCKLHGLEPIKFDNLEALKEPFFENYLKNKRLEN